MGAIIILWHATEEETKLGMQPKKRWSSSFKAKNGLKLWHSRLAAAPVAGGGHGQLGTGVHDGGRERQSADLRRVESA